MINKDDLLKQEALYIYRGQVWKIAGYCPSPSVTMRCTASGERINFGLGGGTDKEFKMIKEVEE